jgi:uncharacterized protein (DUF924 family)
MTFSTPAMSPIDDNMWMDPRAREVLAFWFGAEPKKWFVKDPDFDREIRGRFLALHEVAAAEKLDGWKDTPGECLALVIALDQFPRNMFRGDRRAFAADALALAAARHAVGLGYDRGMRALERMFLYLPYEHSESLADQLVSCELNARLLAFPEAADVHEYAVRHRRIVERFGRFPHRNAILGRTSTPQELEFLKQPGSGF